MFLAVLIAFVVGVILGRKGWLNFILRYNPITFITLFLLFFMGYEIGSNEKLVHSLDKIGYLALSLAIFSLLGSVLFTTIFDKMMKSKNEGVKQ